MNTIENIKLNNISDKEYSTILNNYFDFLQILK